MDDFGLGKGIVISGDEPVSTKNLGKRAEIPRPQEFRRVPLDPDEINAGGDRETAENLCVDTLAYHLTVARKNLGIEEIKEISPMYTALSQSPETKVLIGRSPIYREPGEKISFSTFGRELKDNLQTEQHGRGSAATLQALGINANGLGRHQCYLTLQNDGRIFVNHSMPDNSHQPSKPTIIKPKRGKEIDLTQEPRGRREFNIGDSIEIFDNEGKATTIKRIKKDFLKVTNQGTTKFLKLQQREHPRYKLKTTFLTEAKKPIGKFRQFVNTVGVAGTLMTGGDLAATGGEWTKWAYDKAVDGVAYAAKELYFDPKNQAEEEIPNKK